MYVLRTILYEINWFYVTFTLIIKERERKKWIKEEENEDREWEKYAESE